MTDYRFEQEDVWKLARELAWDVYSVTSRGAFESDHRMRNSVRSASFAIMANVAEGMERSSPDAVARYLSDAREQIGELQHQLLRAQQKAFINSATLARLERMLASLGCMISALMISFNQQCLSAESVSVDYQTV